MSKPEITEAGDTFVHFNSSDAQMSTGKAQKEIDLALPSDTLQVEVTEVVDALFQCARGVSRQCPNWKSLLPDHLSRQLRKLLSKEGLEELPSRSRQEARLRLLRGIGLCVAQTSHVVFVDTDLVGEIELSSSDLEALYGRLGPSTTLKSLEIAIPANAVENWEPERWPVFADILLAIGAQVPEEIFITDMPLSTLSQLTKAVVASWRSEIELPVRRVRIDHGLQDQRFAGTIEEWAGTVASLNVVVPNLKELRIEIGPFADECVAKLIGEAVASHQSLEKLRIVVRGLRAEIGETLLQDNVPSAWKSEGRGTSVQAVSTGENKMGVGPIDRLLSEAFLGHPVNTSINLLSVTYSENTSWMANLEVLSKVLPVSIHVSHLELRGVENIPSRDLCGVLEDLQANGHVHSLVLQQHLLYRHVLEGGPLGFDLDSFAMLIGMLKSNSLSSLKHLSLQFSSDVFGYFEALDWPGFYTSLMNRQMESVSISGCVGFEQAEPQILEWIECSRGLQELSFSDARSESINWASIFRSVVESRSVRLLRVGKEALEDDDAYREIMKIVQLNLLDVEFEGNGPREAAVREALRSRKWQGSYLEELRIGLGQTNWQWPRYGRVYLCGSPASGKTRLTRAMLELASRKPLMQKLKERFLRRTEGVEIHVLRNDDHMQIHVWDLASQDVFLQKVLFPKLSRAYSVFIFVFSAFWLSQGTGRKKLKPGVGKAFEKELLESLRFIVTNSGVNLPRVMVVISHRDLHGIHLTWMQPILAKVIVDFEDVVHIDPTPYFVDTDEFQHVRPTVEKVYSIFEELFKRAPFKVPIACSHLSQLLVRWALENPEKPVIDDRTFFSICENIPELQTFSKTCHECDDSMRLMKAVGSYLHDVGTVFFITSEEIMEELGQPKSNLLVVNPNWLTHQFLGNFINLSYGFQLAPWLHVVDGFMCETDFQQVLCKFLEPMKKHAPKLTLETLQDLMENLDLLYVTKTEDKRGDSDCRFFIPTFVRPRSSEQTLLWHQSERVGLAGEICYLGVRLCCKDSQRTDLSPAFFNRFQVMICQKFMEEVKSCNPLIESKFSLISILVDGFQILIENDEDGDFIDVLIRSSKSRKAVWNYVEKYIVMELRDFCASFRGCPGVELVTHIIRRQCVECLTQLKYRKDQSVSKEILKRNLMMSVEELGVGSDETDLYCHIWPALPESQLTAEAEEAVDLLSPDDVHDVYTWTKSKTQGKVDRLKAVVTEVDIELSMGDHGYWYNQTSSSLQQSKEKWPSLPRHEETILADRDLKGDARSAGEDVREGLAGIRNLNRFHRSEVKILYRKLDQLMGHSMFTKGLGWPKRPYFTHKDVSVSHRITAVVDTGKPLVLHFECEERDGHHFVPKQSGYEIQVGIVNCEVLRQISKTSVRVIWYLLKAGLHISTGKWDLAPELQTSDGNTTSLSSLSMALLLHKVQLQTSDPCSPEEAWRYLQDFLESNVTSRITECFLLHPAVYVDIESTHAWLCQRCLEAGLKGRKLKKL